MRIENIRTSFVSAGRSMCVYAWMHAPYHDNLIKANSYAS